MTRFDDGRPVAVIGACGTIGSAICRAFAGSRAPVIVLDVDPESAAQLARTLPGEGHLGSAINVTSLESVLEAAALAGEVGSVVYTAGIETTCDVIDTDWADYRRLIEINLTGAIAVGQAFARPMIEAGRGGTFAYLSSVAGKRGEAGASAYCASKFGLLGVVECFAAEVARHGIRVNAICPGNVDSPMLRSVAKAEAARGSSGDSAGSVIARYAEESPERRLVDPDEVAQVALWLCSSAASGINGESINVDAGALTG